MSRSDTAVLSLRITAIVVALWGLTQLFFAFASPLQLEDQVIDSSEFAVQDPEGDFGGLEVPPPTGVEIEQAYGDLYHIFFYPAITYLVIAGLLFLCSRPLARAWFPPDGECPSHRLDSYGAQAVAFSVIGCFLLATSLPNLVFYFANMLLPFGNVGPMPGSPDGMEGPGGFLFALLKAAVGLVLFFGSRRFAATWHRKAGWSSQESS